MNMLSLNIIMRILTKYELKSDKMKWIQMFVFGHFQSDYVVTSQQLNAVGQPAVCAI